MDWISLIGIITTPLAAAGGWLAGSRKRNNDFLQEMQDSINKLVAENNRLLHEIVEVKAQNADLKIAVKNLTLENEQLRKEVSELNAKLENVKTITRIK
jgi:cell shape-determining protein MreC